MLDCFAVLNEPRRPWLEPDALKQKFLALSATAHPDRVHNAGEVEKRAAQQRYAELNAAYARLREPKDRLQHLLELELGARPSQVQRVPPDLMNLALEVGQLCRETDAFLAEKAKVSSPLLQVQFFERGQHGAAKLVALQQQIRYRQQELMAELKSLDQDWNAAPEPQAASRQALLPRLEELAGLLSYFGRWNAQLQERIVQLSF